MPLANFRAANTVFALILVAKRPNEMLRDFLRDCQIFCVRAVNGLPPGRPCFYQVGLINRSPYSIAN